MFLLFGSKKNIYLCIKLVESVFALVFTLIINIRKIY